MAKIEFHPDQAAVDRVDKLLGSIPGAVQTASRDALNKTMAHGKTVASQDLAGVMTASKGAVAKRIRHFKATKTDLRSSLIVRGGVGLNLASFGPRQTSSGITVRIFGRSTTFEHMFITRRLDGSTDLAGGDRMVAKREGEKRPMAKGRYAGRIILHGPRAGQPLLRQPIVPQRGPSVAETFENTPGIAEDTSEAINIALPKNLNQQIERFAANAFEGA